jgi:hypothetical protein
MGGEDTAKTYMQSATLRPILTIAITITVTITVTVTVTVTHFLYFTTVQPVTKTVPVSLTKHFLFTVLPKNFLAICYTLSVTAFCRAKCRAVG